MGRKPQLTTSRKEYLKENFDSINKADLPNKDEQWYYSLIANGKKSAKRNIRFEGKYLSGQIVEVISKVAERKKLSLKKYLEQNREGVHTLIDQGYTVTERRPDAVNDLIAGQKKKTVEVDDGNGITRISKAEAIERIVKLQQFAASNTTIVSLGINTKVFTNNRVRVTIPSPEFYEDMTPEEFEEMLDELGIYYVKSAKAE